MFIFDTSCLKYPKLYYPHNKYTVLPTYCILSTVTFGTKTIKTPRSLMEIQSKIDHFNISRICRTCLMEKDVMKALFEPDESIGQSVARRIMDFANIQLEVGDGLPSLICLDCIHQADIAYSFKQLCKKSDRNLRQFLERSPIFVDVKKEEEEVEAADYVFVDSFVMDDFSHNGDKEDEGDEANIKEEKIDPADYQVVDGLVGNLKVEDSSSKCPADIKQEEVETTDYEIVSQKKYDNTIESSLKAHMKTHRNKRSFECDICQKKFTHAGNFKTHMMIHTNGRPFECDICQKKFTHECKLKTHMMKHTNERPFECNICQKNFTQMFNLKTHMKIHGSERPFECNICQKKCTYAWNLKIHMMTHTNERAFECNICQKRFISNVKLKNHMRTHTNERPFACEFCKKAFKQSDHLTKHQRLHGAICQKRYSDRMNNLSTTSE